MIDIKKIAYNSRMKAIEENSDVIVTSTYAILFANQMACNLIADLNIYFKEDNIFKQGIKKDLKLLQSAALEFDNMMSRIYGSKEDYFVGTYQSFIKEVKPKVDILFYSILNSFRTDRTNNYSYRSSLARLKQSELVVDIACKVLEEQVCMLQKINSSIPKLEYLSIDKLSQLIKKLFVTIKKHLNSELTFNVETNPDIIKKSIYKTTNNVINDSKTK